MKRYIFRSIILLLVIASIYSCKSEKRNTGPVIIDVEGAIGNYTFGKLSDYMNEIRYIRLETTDSSLLGNISDICYECGHLYISDINDCCMIFDENGKFIRSIKRIGRGPEEYNEIRNIAVNPSNGNLLILTPTGEIVEYRISGEFVRRIGSPDGIGNPFCFMPLGNDNFFISTFKFHQGVSPENCYVIIDDSLNVIRSGSDMNGYVISNTGSPAPVIAIDPYNIYRFGKDFYASQTSNDTIFCIKADSSYKMTPHIIFNLGKYKDESVRSLIPGKAYEKKVITKYSVIFETNDYIFIKFDLRALAPEPFERSTEMQLQGNGPIDLVTTVCGIYDKKRKQLSLMKQPVKCRSGMEDDIKGGPVFWPVFSTSRGELITYYNAVNLISMAEEEGANYPGLTQIIGNLGENDNPVIAIAR
ncbi:MAG: 6-bladed beta-propeller [Rikenellaceae bacterium]|nr:6-bladed beta-propeller [Rikenellaceae bacterium]